MQFIYKGELYDYIYDDIKGKLVFDIGSNIGQITRRLINADCKVVAVEPLVELTFNENYDGVYAIKHKCASDEIKEIDFYKCEKSLTRSSCLKSWRNLDSVRTLPPKKGSVKWVKTTASTTTLDALIEEFGKPKYIKIDVEGYEDKVLEGLSHKIDLISFEFVGGVTDKAIRCLDILEEKFGFKRLLPFMKKKIKDKNGKITKLHAYVDEFYDKKGIIKYFDKELHKVIKQANRDVADILVIL
jgi:FkbM family methyltransferase